MPNSTQDERRERNRAQMPQVAEFVRLMTEAFGPVSVVYAAEGGKEMGRSWREQNT